VQGGPIERDRASDPQRRCATTGEERRGGSGARPSGFLADLAMSSRAIAAAIADVIGITGKLVIVLLQIVMVLIALGVLAVVVVAIMRD
jgi:hypothetical protein